MNAALFALGPVRWIFVACATVDWPLRHRSAGTAGPKARGVRCLAPGPSDAVARGI
ncbi:MULTISPECIES: hypothetical protein [Streptomyces]|uniref:hypothetical protein n=1 Tax=Streptomyces TaxID=1883 RepID=UPI00163BDE67|nr:hypothetical protein [Streptomyces sp. WAC05858]WTB06782.1 hypothetical protein OG546_22750 [Streptomyces antimycoticus]